MFLSSYLPYLILMTTWHCADAVDSSSTSHPWVWTAGFEDNSPWSIKKQTQLEWVFRARSHNLDSLVVPWPEKLPEGDGLRLTFHLKGRGRPEDAFVQIAYARYDSSKFLVLPYTDNSPLLPNRDDLNCFSISVDTTLSMAIDPKTTSGVVFRIVGSVTPSDSAGFLFEEIYIESSAKRVSLFPFPISEQQENSNPEGSAVPLLGNARWFLTGKFYNLASQDVARISFRSRLNGNSSGDITAFYRLAEESSWVELPLSTYVWPYGEFLSGVLLASENPSLQADSLQVQFSIRFPGGSVLMGIPTVETRSALPCPGEIVINELLVSPTESEFIELYSTLHWPVPLAQLELYIGGEVLSLDRCPSIGPQGYAVLSSDLLPDMTLPNSGARIRLTYEERTIDSLAFGFHDSLPAPPYAWVLARESEQWILDSESTPGRPNKQLTLQQREGDSLFITECSLWQQAESDRFIEIANVGLSSVDLSGWRLICEDVLELPKDATLAPGGLFVVIAEEFPTYFSLNADEGNIILLRPTGVVADRFCWVSPPEPGLSYHRKHLLEEEVEMWEQGMPLPGSAPLLFDAAPCEIKASRIAEGAVIQWTCLGSDDTALYHVYRSPSEERSEGEQVSAFPVTGPTPYSFVDVTVDFEQSYVYWIVIEKAGREDSWFGPIYLPAASQDIAITLGSPHPNPFHGTMSLAYSIQSLSPELIESLSGDVQGQRMRLGVYNLNGRLVKLLGSNRPEQGSFTASWDGRDENGQLSPPGVYVVTLQVGSFVKSVKVVFTGSFVGNPSEGSFK